MLSLIIIIFILIVSIYAIYITKNEKLKYLIVLSTILILLLIRNKETFLNYAPLSGEKPFYSAPVPGSYADRNFKNCKQQNVPLLTKATITSPVGDDIQLTNDPVSYSFPHVDGTPDSAQSLFMFKHNQSSLACCPSTFSDDRGCICLTENQRKMFS